MGTLDPASITSRLDLLNKGTDEEIANTRLEQILNAIQNQDTDALRALFSENVLSETDDFDGNAERLFDFFLGDVESWKKLSGPTVYNTNDRYVIKEINSYYSVNTGNGEYFFLLRDFPIDTGHPSNVGLYLLLLVKSEDEEKIWDGENNIIYDGDTKIDRKGIYLPFV